MSIVSNKIPIQLSVIIVNYNVKYFLEQALHAVRKAAHPLSAEVFVVDNNSADGSVEMVREKFPEVQLIANSDNPGFSIANNQAIKLSKGKYVLLLNPDTVVEEDTFEKVVAFMDAHPDAGGLGVKMIDGSGKFLPESKRGFPSPFVAFCKTFGLSKLFPKSETFNRYHLGYLDENENHEVEVLAGAFMLLRKSVLDEIGLLDEAFFMYGEDIDLSYRIIKAGYKNYYYSGTTILHYKGESTRKGSLNYVKTFYNAMIIFAKKHFKGERAWLYILMLQMAIYFRAGLTLVSNFFKWAYLSLLDATAIFSGMYFLKNFWGQVYFKNPDYYQPEFLYINVPLYIFIWLMTVYLSGGYDRPVRLGRVIRGLLIGTVLLAAVYGFLNAAYRPSRALIVLGMGWAMLSMAGIRLFLHFLKYKNFNIGQEFTNRLAIVGRQEESNRVMELLQKVQVNKNLIGVVSPEENSGAENYLGRLNQLKDIVYIYKINEIIFCSSDISSQEILKQMTEIGSEVQYKILPKESMSIIGSSSKDAAGELYTVDIQYKISTTENRRNKRLLDIFLSFMFLTFFIILIFIIKNPAQFFINIWKVLLGQNSWVGYAKTSETYSTLPKIKPGILSPVHGLKLPLSEERTIQRLNFLYAKDYATSRDWDIVWKGRKSLGDKT